MRNSKQIKQYIRHKENIMTLKKEIKLIFIRFHVGKIPKQTVSTD